MDKKFELVKQEGTCLYRIKALRTGPWGPAGILGGFVEKESNLSHYGNCWIYGDAKVYGDARVFDNAEVYDDARVFDNAKVSDDAVVFGYARVFGYVNVFGSARVYDNVYVSGGVRVFDNAEVCGNAEVFGSASVYDNAEVFDNARVYRNAKVCGDARVVYDLKLHPYYINGSEHNVNYVGHNDEKPMIMIGCKIHSLEHWLENYREIGYENDYTGEQIEEYGLYLDLFKKLLS
jgi:carbonic anhydrase/acetyltransferase-like protein (isoleucine patch superfamily)